MSIVYQTNKQTGITYAYNNEAYWDKEKQQSRAKRVLIGKVDPVTGEIIATREYRKPKVPKQNEIVKPGHVPMSKLQRSFFGAG